MNEDEKRQITEDGRWPLLKTRPDNLPDSDRDPDGNHRPSAAERRTGNSRTGNTAGNAPQRRQSAGRRETDQQSRRTESERAERRPRSYGAERGAGRVSAAGRERNDSSRERSRRSGSEGGYIRNIPGRFRQMIKDPASDIPFLIECIAVVVLIVLVIALIINAVSGGKANTGRTEESVSAVSSTSSAASQEAAAYTPTDIKFSFAGDVLMGMDENTSYSSSFNAFYDLNGADYFFRNVKNVFSADDISIVDLVGTLTDETTRSDNTYAYKGDPSYAKILSDASIEEADLANDHTSDYGEASYTDTVSALETAGVAHFGNDDVAVKDVRGISVGFYGIDQTDSDADAEARMKAAVEKLKAQNANVIVGYFYWGSDQDTYPTEAMTQLAHSAIDAGTDIVVGSGSHLLEGIEYYGNRVIDYGLGSFCYGGDTNPSDVRTIIFQPTVAVGADGTVTDIKLNIVPCQMCSDENYNDYQPAVLTGDDAQAVLDELDQRSQLITENYSDITTVYNSKTDGTAGVNGQGIGKSSDGDESVSSTSGSETVSDSVTDAGSTVSGGDAASDTAADNGNTAE